MAEEEIKAVEEEPFQKTINRKKLLLYAGIFVLQLVAAFYLVKYVILPNDSGSESVQTEEPAEMPKEHQALGILYKMNDLTVNPKGTLGRRYAVFELVLEVGNEQTVEILKQYDPLIRDKILSFFRTKTVEELAMTSEIDSMKSTLKDLVNEIIRNEGVNNIYFTRFVLQ